MATIYLLDPVRFLFIFYFFNIKIWLYIDEQRDFRGVTIIVIRNGYGDQSSNPEKAVYISHSA